MQPAFLFVAAGMAYKLFTKDLPPTPSIRTMVYYTTLLFVLGVLLRLIPYNPALEHPRDSRTKHSGGMTPFVETVRKSPVCRSL
jgi:hypothetical protein